VKTVPGLEQTNGVTAKAVLPQINGADHNGGIAFFRRYRFLIAMIHT
jgi:hypothetical protein